MYNPRGWWILWVVFTIAWALPLVAGVLWLLTYQPNPSSQTVETVLHGMIVCILAMGLSSVMNLWMYLWQKRSSRSSRWLARGFVWTIVVIGLAVLWVHTLFMALFDEFSEHGAFIGWFGFALILVAMVAFNLAVYWRRSHMRRRRRSRSRMSAEDSDRSSH